MKRRTEGRHAKRAGGVLLAVVLGVLIVGGGWLWSGAYRGSQGSASSARFETASMRVAWDPSVHERVAGYKVLYGTEPGKYTHSLSVGNRTTTATLLGLKKGTRYYVVVVAFDSEQNQSPPSNEIEVVPRD